MNDQPPSRCPFGFGNETSDEGAAAPATSHMAMAPGLSRDKLPELLREPIAPGTAEAPTGRCLCGKVSFRINRPVSMVFAYHDAVSRRRSGGVAISVLTRATNTAFNGWGGLVQYPLGNGDVSAFCRACGTPVFVRHTEPEAMDGMISISAGALDATEGLNLAAEICHDEKPGYYAFEGERRRISTAELQSMFRQPGT